MAQYGINNCSGNECILRLSSEEAQKLEAYAEWQGVSPDQVLTSYITRLRIPKPNKKLLRLEARLLILQALDIWRERTDKLAMVADLEFVDSYFKRQLSLPGWVYDTIPATSRATLHNWRQLRQEGKLIGRWKGRIARFQE